MKWYCVCVCVFEHIHVVCRPKVQTIKNCKTWCIILFASFKPIDVYVQSSKCQPHIIYKFVCFFFSLFIFQMGNRSQIMCRCRVFYLHSHLTELHRQLPSNQANYGDNRCKNNFFFSYKKYFKHSHAHELRIVKWKNMPLNYIKYDYYYIFDIISFR